MESAQAILVQGKHSVSLLTIDGYPATPLHCPRDRSLPVAGCYFSGSPRAALVSRLKSTSPTSRPGFRLGNSEQWSPTGHVFPSNL